MRKKKKKKEERIVYIFVGTAGKIYIGLQIVVPADMLQLGYAENPTYIHVQGLKWNWTMAKLVIFSILSENRELKLMSIGKENDGLLLVLYLFCH